MKESKKLRRMEQPTGRMPSVSGQAAEKVDATTDLTRSEEHTSELQSRQYLHSFPTRRSSDLPALRRRCGAPGSRSHSLAAVNRPQTGEGRHKTTYERVKKTEKNGTANRPDAVRVRPGRRKGGRDDRSDEIGRAHV